MQRVMIVGGPGSGKSTLARQIGAATGLPVHHMDHIHHLPGWKPRPMPEKKAMAQAITDTPRWVFEGGMSSTYAERARRADTLIWLDLPVGLRLWRVLARIWHHYGERRPDMAEGCTETLGWHTVEFIDWIFRTRRSQRARIAQLVADNRHSLTVHHLQSRAAVRAFAAAKGLAPPQTDASADRD